MFVPYCVNFTVRIWRFCDLWMCREISLSNNRICVHVAKVGSFIQKKEVPFLKSGETTLFSPHGLASLILVFYLQSTLCSDQLENFFYRYLIFSLFFFYLYITQNLFCIYFLDIKGITHYLLYVLCVVNRRAKTGFKLLKKLISHKFLKLLQLMAFTIT